MPFELVGMSCPRNEETKLAHTIGSKNSKLRQLTDGGQSCACVRPIRTKDDGRNGHMVSSRDHKLRTYDLRCRLLLGLTSHSALRCSHHICHHVGRQCAGNEAESQPKGTQRYLTPCKTWNVLDSVLLQDCISHGSVHVECTVFKHDINHSCQSLVANSRLSLPNEISESSC